jgi:hypothetical protein
MDALGQDQHYVVSLDCRWRESAQLNPFQFGHSVLQGLPGASPIDVSATALTRASAGQSIQTARVEMNQRGTASIQSGHQR